MRSEDAMVTTPPTVPEGRDAVGSREAVEDGLRDAATTAADATGVRVAAPIDLGASERLIGAILVQLGALDASDIDMVLQEAEQSELRFGEAAVRLRLVDAATLRRGLAVQYAFPCLDTADPALRRRLPVAFRPDSPFAEALRSIRSRILDDWRAAPGRARTIAVVSLDAGDGRSFFAANLAVALAQMEERTLLIDADLRRPSQHETFGVKTGTGLAGILSGRSGFEQVMHFVGLDNLSLLQAGPPVPNPQELLGRPRFRQMLDELEPGYGAIVIDTPPAATVSDAQLVARRAGAAILVARADATRQDRLLQLAAHLQRSGVLVASIVNRH